MHIVIGAVVVLVLLFFPGLLAVIAGVWAGYWSLVAVIFVVLGAAIAVRFALKYARGFASEVQSASVESSLDNDAESPINYSPHKESMDVRNCTTNDPAPVASKSRLALCGACKGEIERYAIYCPKCGKDPRVKK